ncbi:magnesium transporter [Kineosphaera limosa]|uniref:Magnesium transport protein CorA n=1 Tax=Kineosphaera limosa NBRC 100340 TaxID=1184609 RepID=K6WL45_9MICO|nr:magnesium/cobalt transporter CorA [Kineosphaera limosa]NYE03194.1 magnesium transporter [Kineosphaera limosa]GAB94531.1 magnesium transport protein CorA [Kineosphaera limosa NBRC 100340]
MIVDKAVYHDGQRLACGHPSAELERLRESGNGFLWIGVKDPTDAEFAEINHELRLHPLAVEDAVLGNQRPKIDIYEESMFVVLKTLRYVEATSDVETGELMLFVGDQFVLTVRRGEVNPLDGVRHRLEAESGLLGMGPLAVLHAVLDHIVDTYRAIDLQLLEDLENIEEAIFAGDRTVTGQEIYQLKREVLEFKRGALPLVIPLRRLVTGETRVQLPKKLRPFYNDVLDHLLQVVDHAEAYDRLLSDILAAYLAQVSVQQNNDMRKISAWVAMAAVPTMIAGVYGQNFDFMPELHWEYGYYLSLGLMAGVVVLLYVLFRRSGWL